MKPIVTSLISFLQRRKGNIWRTANMNHISFYLFILGEVECGFQPKNDVYVTKREINEYLDGKVFVNYLKTFDSWKSCVFYSQGFKFEAGSEERWKTLITYIFDKPVDDIL